MLGRAARMMSCPGWKPPVMSSRSSKPDATPVTACPPDSARIIDPIHRLLDDILELEGFAADLVLGDGEDLVLGRLEQLLGGELVGITVADDLGRAFDQLAVGRFFLDDVGVVLGVGGGGNAFDDLGEDVVTADLLELIALLQLFGEGDGVDRLAGVVEVSNGRVDHLMGIAVEVFGAQEDDDVVEGLVVEQDAAQDAPLGFEVLGGSRSLGEGDAVICQSISAAVACAHSTMPGRFTASEMRDPARPSGPDEPVARPRYFNPKTLQNLSAAANSGRPSFV